MDKVSAYQYEMSKHNIYKLEYGSWEKEHTNSQLKSDSYCN